MCLSGVLSYQSDFWHRASKDYLVCPDRYILQGIISFSISEVTSCKNIEVWLDETMI